MEYLNDALQFPIIVYCDFYANILNPLGFNMYKVVIGR